MKLNQEELELIKSLQNEEWKQIDEFQKKKLEYEKYANKTLRKDKSVSQEDSKWNLSKNSG